MFGMDIIKGIGHKIKGGTASEEARRCRSLMMTIPRTQPVDIDFEDITFEVKVKKEKKMVLKGVSGKFKSGELTAIMGPSGAGKSSLLNILTGFHTTGASGTISNKDCTRINSNQYKKESCYILQDDQLCPLFTVQEIMMMAADLKLGNNLSNMSKQIVVDEILETLGLTSTKKTRCSRLSGGQRKRLSIALELIDNPPIMFLDEPTTGLDSSASRQCISMLKNLARGGRTIVCTIHQPSALLYELFDHVYILAEGMCVYQGATSNTVDYLKSFGFECPKYHNPADYMLEIANCEYGNFNTILATRSNETRWRTCLKVNDSEEVVVDRERSEKTKIGLPETCRATVLITPPSEISRFWTLFSRCIKQLHRDWTVTHLKVVLHCCVGIILGLTFMGCGSNGAKTISNMGYLVIGIVYLTYTTMMPALLRFPNEIMILKKENFNNWYKLRTYYTAVILCNTPLQLFFATIYSGISYCISSQPMELERFLMFLTILLLVTLIAEAIGHVIGTLVNPVNGTFLGAILTCALLVFAGFLVQFPHMSVIMRTISYFSYFRYSLTALMQSIYGFGRPTLPCPNDMYCHMRYPSQILETLGMDNDDFWRCVMILFLCLVVLKFLAFFTLKQKLRKN